MQKKVVKNILYALSFLLLLIGFIYFGTKDFDKENSSLPDNEKFAKTYTKVDKNNVFLYTNIDEALSFFDNGNAILFIGIPKSSWCQYYAKFLNEVAIDETISKIYYLDIETERIQNSKKYRRLVTYLDDYLYRDDLSVSHLYVPELVVIKNGKIIGHDNETAIMAGTTTAETYWTVEKIASFKEKISRLFQNQA